MNMKSSMAGRSMERGPASLPGPVGDHAGPDEHHDARLFIRLFEACEARNVSMCAWKGLEDARWAIEGDADLDLLVHRGHAAEFREVMAEFGFKAVTSASNADHAAIVQYVGIDTRTHHLARIDAYHRLVTGEKFVKQWHLPLETVLLENVERVDRIPIPNPDASLAVFVLRAILKGASIMDLAVAGARHAVGSVRAEAQKAVAAADLTRTEAIVQAHLPAIPPQLWRACVSATLEGAPWPKRFWLRMRLSLQLRPYRRHGPLRAAWLRVKAIGRRAARIGHAHPGVKHLATGGAVIAIVGPEATGKSTLAGDLARWLGSTFQVHEAHLGKPPPTPLTWLPSLALPLLRRIARGHRTDAFPAAQDGASRPSWLFAVRCLITALERRNLAWRLHMQAANGHLVICDRYPSAQVGAMDSARLPENQASGWRSIVANWEQRLYRQVPPPDVVLELTVAPEIAVRRNRERSKPGKESDEHILRRHATGSVPRYAATTVSIDTSGMLADTLARAKEAVWHEL